jgi:O-methyltransferase
MSNNIKDNIFQYFRKFIWNFKRWELIGLAQRPNFNKLYSQVVYKEKTNCLEINELFNVYSAVISTKNLTGDIAEVGVFRGGSAKAICWARDFVGSTKSVHLFDTFEGLPEVLDVDTKWNRKSFKKGEFSETSLEGVQKYLRNYKDVNFYKGFFPKTAKPVEKVNFSFVHLDVDIYQSTKDALEFFYSRINKGGIIISHDYPFAKGVKKAFDEFFADKEETVIQLLNKQALVVKL